MKKLPILFLSSLFITTINFSLVAVRTKSSKNKRAEKLQNKIQEQQKKHLSKAGNRNNRHLTKIQKREQEQKEWNTIMQAENSRRSIDYVSIKGHDNLYRAHYN